MSVKRTKQERPVPPHMTTPVEHERKGPVMESHCKTHKPMATRPPHSKRNATPHITAHKHAHMPTTQPHYPVGPRSQSLHTSTERTHPTHKPSSAEAAIPHTEPREPNAPPLWCCVFQKTGIMCLSGHLTTCPQSDLVICRPGPTPASILNIACRACKTWGHPPFTFCISPM